MGSATQLVSIHPRYPAWDAVRLAATALGDEQLLLMPTDTLYGLAASIWSARAIARVRAAKGIPPSSPLLVLAPDTDWALALTEPCDETARELMKRFWPGPLTLILPASGRAPAWVRGAEPTLAVRVPGASAAREVIAAAGFPVVAPSANRHGQRPVASGAEAALVFGDELDLVLDGGPLRAGAASTLVDLTGSGPRLARAGALPADDLAPWLRMGPARAGAAGRARPFRVLFVCAGNTCRSPMAAGILRALLPEDARGRIAADSAGTSAVEGMPASPGAQAAAAAAGISLAAHRSRRLTARMLREADLVLVMEPAQLRAVREIEPRARARAHLLHGFAEERARGEGDPIPDPLGGDQERYRSVFAELREALAGALERLLQQAGEGPEGGAAA